MVEEARLRMPSLTTPDSWVWVGLEFMLTGCGVFGGEGIGGGLRWIVMVW